MHSKNIIIKYKYSVAAHKNKKIDFGNKADPGEREHNTCTSTLPNTFSLAVNFLMTQFSLNLTIFPAFTHYIVRTFSISHFRRSRTHSLWGWVLLLRL